MIASSPAAPRAAVNPIDALITAGRLYAAHAAVLLPVALFLQALKAATLLGLMDALGEDAGSLIGRFTSTALLWALMGVAALVALDARGGAVGSGGSLVRRGVALLPKVVMLAFLYTFAIAAGLALVIVPGLIALVLGLLAMPALIAGNLSPTAALKESSRLVQTALLPSILLAALLAFSLELIPALADSAVGRHAPLGTWLVAEATISAAITPLMALAITAFFIALADDEGTLSPPLPTPADAIAAARNTALPGSQRAAQAATVRYQPPPAPLRPLATFTPAPAAPGIGGDLARVMQVPAEVQCRQRVLGRFVGAWAFLTMVAVIVWALVEQDRQTGETGLRLLIALTMLPIIASFWSSQRLALRAEHQRYARSILRTGEVIDLRPINLGGIRGPRLPVVRLSTHDGRVIERSPRLPAQRLAVGQAVEVRYDPEQDLIDLVRKKPTPLLAVDAMNGLIVVVALGVAVQAALSLAGIV